MSYFLKVHCFIPVVKVTRNIFLIQGDEAVKILAVKFVDLFWFLSRCCAKVQHQHEINKKLGNRVVACRVSVDARFDPNFKKFTKKVK